MRCVLGLMLSASLANAASDAEYMAEYYLWHNTSETRWLAAVPLPAGQLRAGPIDWVTKGAVTPATSQGRCGTCQSFSCIADVEGAWFTSGHALTKLSEQEMIDCGGGDHYGACARVLNPRPQHIFRICCERPMFDRALPQACAGSRPTAAWRRSWTRPSPTTRTRKSCSSSRRPQQCRW